MGEPTGGCISYGSHYYDFQTENPPGYNYGSDPGHLRMYGQKGGLGGVLQTNKWYCVESRLKLNTVFPETPGFLPDGEHDVWIDGRLTFSRRGMVYRTLPLTPMNYVETSIRPARELGVAYLDFCWYHGGTDENPIDMRMFVTGLVWGKEYIGPMKI
jgi:hypothetical protein